MKKKAQNARPGASNVLQRVAAPLIFGMAVVLAAAYFFRVEGGFLWKLDRQVLDEFHISGKKTAELPDVVVLGIDDASQSLDSLWPEEIAASPALQAMQKRPWPRTVWAYTLDRLIGAGAKAVFIDVTFKGQSLNPQEDAMLKEVLARHAGKVVLGGNFETLTRGDANWGKTQFTPPTATILDYKNPRQQLGYLNFWDEEGVVRKLSTLGSLKQAELHHLQTQPLSFMQRYQVEMELKDELRRRSEDARLSVAFLMAQKLRGSNVQPVAAEQRFRFCKPSAYVPISLHEIFVEDIWKNNFHGGELFRDKVILVGATATDLQDFHQTPVGRIAGVQLHAHALSAIAAGHYIKEAPASLAWISVLISGVLAWLIVTYIRQPVLSLVLIWAASALVIILCWWAFNGWSLEASPVASVLALNLCGLAGLSGNYLTQMRETRQLRRFLARYTSPELVDEMLNDREGIYTTLRGAERPVTILFSDVRGFTSMSEGMSASEVVAQLNEYLSRMVEQAFKHRGVVDKFIGDAVMALWGSLRSESHAQGFAEDSRSAVAAALAMRAALKQLNAEWQEKGLGTFSFGVGIHHGPVVVGNIGSESPYEKMDITVIGDNVNLASRLEGATKEYGVDLIISSTVRDHLGDEFICRSADLVKVKGKQLPVEVFTVLGSKSDPVPDGLNEYETGVAHYRAGDFVSALARFREAQSLGLDDTLTSTYIARCEQLLKSPPEEWDGVFVMKNK